MKALNLLLRFLLELSALVALGYWGFHAGGLLLCIGAPILFAVMWWLFAAHKAKFPPRQPWKAVVGFLFLEIAAVGLALAGQGVLAEIFAGLIAGNAVVLRVWNRWS